MSADDIFFTVIIPTRNRPIEFKKALDSVLEQTYQSVEVVVVNDGTNAQHRPAYDELENASPDNVTYLNLIERSRGHGHCFARNQGADIAKGKFICFLDDDDWWIDPDFLNRAANKLQETQADFYFANQKAVTHDGKEINNVWVENLPSTLAQDDPRQNETVFAVSVSEMLKATGFPHQNCWAISKELYFSIEGMDENLRYEPDRDIYLRALDRASALIYDKTTIALHNIPDNSKKNNASTLTSSKQKLLFQLRTAEKGVLFSTKPEIAAFCVKRKGYILKKLTEILDNEGNTKLAYVYAKEALGVSFTFKWFLFTMLCALKSVFR